MDYILYTSKYEYPLNTAIRDPLGFASGNVAVFTRMHYSGKINCDMVSCEGEHLRFHEDKPCYKYYYRWATDEEKAELEKEETTEKNKIFSEQLKNIKAGIADAYAQILISNKKSLEVLKANFGGKNFYGICIIATAKNPVVFDYTHPNNYTGAGSDGFLDFYITVDQEISNTFHKYFFTKDEEHTIFRFLGSEEDAETLGKEFAESKAEDFFQKLCNFVSRKSMR
jgi:hypothetical protein